MAYKVRMTLLAEADVSHAYEYVREEFPENAEQWLLDLFAAIMSLADLPGRCPLIPEAEEMEYQAHQLLYGRRANTYRIIFDIQETSDEGPRVRVLRIWHGSRDHITGDDIAVDLPF